MRLLVVVPLACAACPAPPIEDGTARATYPTDGNSGEFDTSTADPPPSAGTPPSHSDSSDTGTRIMGGTG